MKRKGWIGFLIGIFFCLLMVLPPVIHASLDVDGSYSGILLLNSQNQTGGSYWDGTDNTDAYIRAGVTVDGLAGDTGATGWSVFNVGNVYNSSASGLIFGRPWSLESGTLYNRGYLGGYTNGVKMGAGEVTNSGMIYGDSGYGILQYSTGASTFTVNNGVDVSLTPSFDGYGGMTITTGTPETTGIGTIAGDGGGIYSYIGGAGTATVDNAGLIIGYGGAGVGLYGNGTSTATVTNSGTIYGGYDGSDDGIYISGVLNATVTNSSRISGSDDGVDIENTVNATVINVNNGTIDGSVHGVSFYNVTDGTVINSGANIYGYNGNGVYVEGEGSGTVEVINGATVEGETVTITGTGQIRGDELGVGISGMGTATVTNYSAGYGGYGGITGEMLGVGIEDTNIATVNNYGAGLINGMLGGVGMSNVNTATVNNSGTIEGWIFGVGVRNYDEDLEEYIKTGTVTVDNSGTIQGNLFGVVIMGADTATVMNSSVNSISATGSGFGEGWCSGYECTAFGDGVYIKEVNTAEVLNGATIDEEDIVSITGGTIEGIANSYYDWSDGGGSGGYAYAYGKGVKIEDATTATVTNYGDATNIGLISGTANAYGEGADEIDTDDIDDGDAYAYGYGVNIEHVATSTVNNIGGTISGTAVAHGYYGYGEAYGVYIDALWNVSGDMATINNSGDITASGSGYGYYSSAEAYAYGVYIDDAATVTVNNYVATLVEDVLTPIGGTISGTALGQSDGYNTYAYGAGLYVEDAPTAVTVTNYGDITASGTALADMPYGSETVPDYDEYGYAYGDADGIYIYHTAAATVNNIGGTISATGEARGYGGYSDAYGVYIDSLWDSATDTAVINNSGSILASASGFSYGYGYGDIDIPAPAPGYEGGGYEGVAALGVYIDDAATVTVNNYVATLVEDVLTPIGGTISGTALGQSDGGNAYAYGAGVYVEDAAKAVTVTNYGDITGTATALADMPYGSETVPDYDEYGYAYGDADGVYIYHTAAATVNNIGGTISATGEARGYGGYSDAYGVYIDSLWDSATDTAVINNSGTISALASGYSYGNMSDPFKVSDDEDDDDYGVNAYGVYIDDANTVTVNNYVAETVGETTTITGGTISATAFTQTDGGLADAYAAGVYVEDAPTAVTVVNYGTISSSATALADMPYGSETVPDYDEEGYAYGDAAGIYIHHTAAATITNVGGTISATGEASGYGASSGAFGVYIDSLWDDSADTAVINNSGTISASASAYNYGYGDGGFVTGAGGFEQGPFLGFGGAFAGGVYVDDADTVTVNNYVATVQGETTTITGGTISSTAFNQTDGGFSGAFAAGVFIEDADTVTVTTYGDITSSATALGDMPYGSQTVPDYDEGIAFAGAIGVGIADAETATVNNIDGTITGTATAYGEYAEAFGGGVEINNISAPRTATVNNSGTISGNGAGNSYGSDGYGYGGGVYIEDAETATVFNGAIIDEEENLIITGGTISGTGTGNGYNGYGGYGYGYGVYIEDASTATVTNYGDITGTGTGYSTGDSIGEGYGYGVYMNNIYGIETAIVTNIGGTISGQGFGLNDGYGGYGNGYGYGVYMHDVDVAVVTNGAIDEEVITGGTISGTGNSYADGVGYGYGVYINNANEATVTNYGTITATGSGYGGSYGIYLGHFVDEGDVYNYGTITATGGYGGENFAIYVDGPAKNVTLGTGSAITGLVYSEDEGNNIILEAAGATDFNEINANQIDGFSDMDKTGPGTWVLNGDKNFTQYSEEGTLYERDMPITVTGGVLAFGARETTAGVRTPYLTVAEDASIGYVITPDGSTGSVTADVADFNGSTVVVIPTPIDANKYLLTTTYEDVLTVGDLVESWGEVTANLAFLTPYLVADNDGVEGVYDLILNRLSFTTGADESTNPLGQFLDELYGSTDDPDTLAWLNYILTQVSEGEAQQALAELSGGSHTAFQLMSFHGLDKYLGILNNHMGGMGGFGGFAGNNPATGMAWYENGGQMAMAGSGDTISDVAPMMLAAVGNMIGQGQAAKGTNWGLWADGYLGTGNRRSDEIITKYKHNLFGGIIGFDYRVAGDLYLGISGGLSRTNVDFDDLLDNGHMDSYHGSLYLNYNGKPWYAAGIATYAYNKYNLDRYITTLGPTQIASSDYSGNEYAGYVEVGYKIDAGNVEIRPLAAFQIDYLEQEAFTETGSDYNLDVDKQNTGSYKSFLGVNVNGTIKLSETAALKPEFRVKWAHEFSNDDHMINASFDGIGSGSFLVKAEKLSRDTAIIGVGMSFLFNKHVSAYIQYDAELNSDYVNHTGLAGLRLAW